jgi:hypothetical protein
MVAQAFPRSRLHNRGQAPENPPDHLRNVASVFFRKEILVNPTFTALCADNASMLVLIQVFLENTATQIIGLTLHYFMHSLAQ